MDARHLIPWDGEHAEGIIGAQVLFGGQGEFGEIGEIGQVIRVHAGGVKAAAVVGDVVVGVA